MVVLRQFYFLLRPSNATVVRATTTATATSTADDEALHVCDVSVLAGPDRTDTADTGEHHTLADRRRQDALLHDRTAHLHLRC
uniref:Putative secreted protein n=1 Tax=Anopheles marajoara TaxID=58244 RepID=A0A2M4CB49_9DIPT